MVIGGHLDRLAQGMEGTVQRVTLCPWWVAPLGSRPSIMYTLRLTRPLLASFEPEPDESLPPTTTTRLGDWYVQPLHAGRHALLQCTSGATLLTVMLPADALGALPERLAIGLVQLLRSLAVPESVIAAEIDEMADGVIRPASGRAVLGAMRGLASLTRREVEGSPRGVDVAALHQALGSYRSRRNDRRPVEQVAREHLLRPGHALERV